MHVVSRKALLAFALSHADAAGPLDTWYRVAKSARWTNLVDLQRIYPATDSVEGFTIFNIKGNAYRLITRINDRSQTIFVRGVYTHAAYDLGEWK